MSTKVFFPSDNIGSHPGLQRLRIQLQGIYDAISNFQPLTSKPPILDSSLDFGGDSGEDGHWLQQEHIPGLKKLRDSVKIDLDVLEKFLNDSQSINLPPLSTNAPYLIAVWNEVQCAPLPIDSVFKLMPLAPTEPSTDAQQCSAQRSPPVKVDVVADNGKRWIRINTIKNSRILSEFREIDSYLTESEDESYENLEDARPTLAQTEFDNSVLRMGRSLLAAAKSNPIEGTKETPQVTLRLTRLDPTHLGEDGEENDPRIAQTLQLLREMGIEVELGERREDELPASRPPAPSLPILPAPPEPTVHINLDLSALIALISDITHAPLPKTVDEANIRYIPSQQYREWKQKKKGLLGKKKVGSKNIIPADIGNSVKADEEISNDTANHSRALTNQLLQEMGKGLLQEIHDRISTIPLNGDESLGTEVKFWTTLEARERCLRIVSKIGGPSEKRRAHAMFPSVSTISTEVISLSQAEDAYWQDSRYPSKFIPLLPIHSYPAVPIPDASIVPEARNPSLPIFFMTLGKTCEDILAQETIPHPRALPENLTGSGSHVGNNEIQRAVVTKANPRLTAHTVQSLLWGAKLGWTTLTANKASIKAILKEVKLARVSGRLDEIPGGDDVKEDKKAAIWVVDPRSLAEGK